MQLALKSTCPKVTGDPRHQTGCLGSLRRQRSGDLLTATQLGQDGGVNADVAQHLLVEALM
jgi:hypothetical protein